MEIALVLFVVVVGLLALDQRRGLPDRRRGAAAALPRMSGRLPSTIASAVGAREEISLRLALPADDVAIERLSQLAGRRLSAGVVLLAEADGEILAAADPNGCVISDPFRVTLDVVELLRLRASQLRSAAA